jgi:hypothetical protein
MTKYNKPDSKGLLGNVPQLRLILAASCGCYAEIKELIMKEIDVYCTVIAVAMSLMRR